MENYETEEFYLACYLELMLNKSCELNMKTKTICTFKFQDKELCSKYADDFFSNTRVGILDYKDKIKNMKSRLHNKLNSK